MEKVLNQEEIDAMIRQARAGGQAPAGTAREPQVEIWDIRRAGQIGRDQLQSITVLHEGFARNLTHSLAAYLRVVFSAALVSAEHLTYREFLQSIPETTYLGSCRLDPIEAAAAFQLDLKVALPIVDLLLGGEPRHHRNRGADSGQHRPDYLPRAGRGLAGAGPGGPLRRAPRAG